MTTAPDPVAYFDNFAGGYASWTNSDFTFRDRLECYGKRIAECRGAAPSDLCLDLGCGNGGLTLLSRRAGFDVVGIDGSASMLAHARAAVPAGLTGVSFLQERLPLRDEIVDEFRSRAGLVIASSVIEYIDDEALFLIQCHELLKPRGHALVSFPNAISPWRRYERILGPRGPLRGRIVEVQRRQHRLQDVHTLADAARLRIVSVSYFGLSYLRMVARMTRRRPRWLATLMLVHFEAVDV